MARHTETAGVLAPPPLLFAAGWVAAMALDHVAPLDISRDRRSARTRRLLGGTLAAAGVTLSGAVVRSFSRASTPVSPLHVTRALVTDGIYSYTRNPDYVGQALLYAALATIGNRLWPLALLPSILALVSRTVIAREERYLAARFGQAYLQYARRVPRCL
jgi:protein-S-isoprenylcysteine O-methyltransferase Ste14